ncbi:uncharacterized protein B0H18DRAFT_1124963 [Fomitopsis serialis]|uniref:uncharacterized protein n=1 Tax=Fomitopsis serialis TaxID=139415 RepID=UPI0020078C00|nr:uncharacterized protein B0H18DRAFT_1124963 [Neoantrodia serialis]KAH9915305.1 hypothetical protein B0H18DRAFT_1124963 [Neoantrodia serialis]
MDAFTFLLDIAAPLPTEESETSQLRLHDRLSTALGTHFNVSAHRSETTVTPGCIGDSPPPPFRPFSLHAHTKMALCALATRITYPHFVHDSALYFTTFTLMDSGDAALGRAAAGMGRRAQRPFLQDGPGDTDLLVARFAWSQRMVRIGAALKATEVEQEPSCQDSGRQISKASGVV